MKYAVVIPARYHSTRLPGKPLVSIAGVPMVVRTYRQCAKACDASRIFVATDDERVAETCRRVRIQSVLTSPDCLTGTDRVAEFAAKIDCTHVINVQGDEPVFPPDDLRAAIAALERFPHDVLNGYCAIETEAQFRRPEVPKVVLRPDGRLLYMSRAAIPTGKRLNFEWAYRQVCVYGFPRAALEAFAARSTKTPLEQIEDIEILRFLELGWDVRMIPMSTESIAVDTPEDVPIVERAIRDRGL